MGIRAYIALGLTVMTLLFTASFFYFMSMAREVSVSGTRTYGLFMTQAESDKLTDSRNMARLRGAEAALAALPSLTAKPAEPEASAALAELSAAIAELATAQPVTDDMLLQLRRTATLAHEFENRLLMGFLLLGAGLVLLFGLLRLHLARPLQSIMVFLNQLGTGSASQPPKHSLITELHNISAALENLGTYLSLATVRSQKLASEHDHFQKMSLVDGLTGVGNRRAFDDKLHSLWLHALQSGTPLALIMLDVDTFKRYNDSLGHQAGDECLRRIAAAMSRAARSTDVCARYGGEEFALLLGDTTADEAERLCSRLQGLFHQRHDWGGVQGLTVTFSAGLVQARSDDRQATDLYQRADHALYRAKSSGRDVTCVE